MVHEIAAMLIFSARSAPRSTFRLLRHFLLGYRIIHEQVDSQERNNFDLNIHVRRYVCEECINSRELSSDWLSWDYFSFIYITNMYASVRKVEQVEMVFYSYFYYSLFISIIIPVFILLLLLFYLFIL